MFYVNNDDMDELFRDAAERYPLKTEGVTDWEKVSDLLQNEAGTPFADAGEYKKEKKRRVFFWWLLLLPLGWIGHESWQKMNAPANEKKQITITEKKTATDTKNDDAVLNNSSKDKGNNPVSVANDADKKIVASDKNNVNSVLIASVNSKKNISGIENEKIKNLKGKKFVATKFDENNNKKDIVIHKQNKSTDNFAIDNKKSNRLVDNGIIDNTDKNDVANNINNNTEKKNDDDAIVKEKLQVPTLKNNDNQKNTTTKTPDAIVKKEKAAAPETVIEKKAAKSTVKLQKDFHFYAALMVGADISTVRFQSVKGMGNSVGLLLGYHFSKSKFNIETGIYWDTKKYYSSGEYFNKSKLPPSWQNENLLYVDGHCNMFEIPINVRYNFIQHKATTFFAVAGLSSYLMNKEAYSYRLEDPTGWAWDGNKSYYHSTQNWFSILNLSLGYEHHLGKIGDIRIEPYVKLPLSGIGLGSLSLSSAGLNIGLSRRF